MPNYKKELIGLLEEAVTELFGGQLLFESITDSGFYCDFDLNEPLNLEKIEAIESWLSGKSTPGAFELSSFSGAYLDGDASNRMLQRIYATAFFSQEELDGHKQRLLEASEHDHRKIGAQLGLFSTSDEIGQGLALWHPKGAVVRFALEQFSQSAHMLNGYQWVYTPHIGSSELWKTSGHLENYSDSMYSPLDIDGHEYYLKPMNCPFHFIIYNSEPHSYRDLPVRMAEFGTVYRYELSGSLSGLARVRGFTQDDAHIICTPEQIEGEVAFALEFSLYILRSFGFGDFKPYISTKPQGKSIGSDEQWEMATDILKKAVEKASLNYEIDEGGGAFYGPKIDLKLYDALGREWQCSTIQFDFNLPERFGMKYTASDGTSKTPYVVHRALFGSIERFFALLIEHYKGYFPLWLAPLQIAVVPIAESHNSYCKGLELELRKLGLRVEGDYSANNMREKIKRFTQQKTPYMLVVGNDEVSKSGFSVRSHKDGNIGFMHTAQLLEFIDPELDMGKPKYIMQGQF
ncbi:MAG: threonine--tRNA ligase [Eubacteriaceae bacterium]|nr:threonine--tRNA ligase [Eubacteriaceae bacterium]